MFNWWVSSVLSQPNGQVILGAWVIWVVLSVTLHELAHGWAAIRRGDTTPIETGHMTWNPIVHMGMTSLIVFALAGIAWGAMPVDPSRMRGRYAHAFVAVMGPVMNFALAIVCIIAGGALLALMPENTPPPKLMVDFHTFFFVGGMLNIALGIFNLLPVPPLDGSRILADFSSRFRDFMQTEAGGFLSFVAFALAFFFAGRLVFGAGAFLAGFGQAGVGFALQLMGVGSGTGGGGTP